MSLQPLSPRGTTLKLWRVGSLKREALDNASKRPQEDIVISEPGSLFKDRRKLNADELQLELSRDFSQFDCEMKRSGSFGRLSRLQRQDAESAAPHPVGKSAKYDEPLNSTGNGSVEMIPMSTPKRVSGVVHTLSAYLGGIGIPTPPSSSRKPREKRVGDTHTSIKESIRHLTPPQTPSPSHSVLPPPRPTRGNAQSTPTRVSVYGRTGLQISEPIESSSSFATAKLSGGSPHAYAAVTSVDERKVDHIHREGIFENPRKLSELPEYTHKLGLGTHIDSHPFGPSMNAEDLGATDQSQNIFDIRTLAISALVVACSLGFPQVAKEAVVPAFPSSRSLPKPCEEPPIQPNLSAVGSKFRRTSVKVSAALNQLSRRRFSTATTNDVTGKYSPYLHLPFPPIQVSSIDDGQSSGISEDSSIENLTSLTSPTSSGAPISAFDDDSSDDDYFGDLMQLPGLGVRNLRRIKTGSKRHSRDSMISVSERPFSRSSLTSKHERLDTLKEDDGLIGEDSRTVQVAPSQYEGHEYLTVDNAGKAYPKGFQQIRENEVLHIKDADGFDHLVLEREDSKVVVVAGTLVALITELCNPYERVEDKSFGDVFFQILPIFSSPRSVLDTLIQNFRIPDVSKREHIIAILAAWIQNHPEDLLGNETTREVLLMFLGETACQGHQKASARLLQAYASTKEKLQRHKEVFNEYEVEAAGQKTLAPTSTLFSENIKEFLEDEDTMAGVAHYLTSVDFFFFKYASVSRTFALWWSSLSEEARDSWSGDTTIPSIEVGPSGSTGPISQFLRRTINIWFWVQYEILSMPLTKDRAGLISSLIDMSHGFRDQGNLHSCLLIVDALGAGPIISLEQTWEDVSIERVRRFSDLRLLLDPKVHDKELSSSRGLAIPYFPFFVRSMATLLNQSTNASFRYNDASKVHVDSTMNSESNRPQTSSSAESANLLSPVLVDFKKYRLFVKDMLATRSRLNCPPDYLNLLEDDKMIFRNRILGNVVACAGLGGMSNKHIPEGNDWTSSLRTPEDSEWFARISEAVEERVETVIAASVNASMDTSEKRKLQLSLALRSLARRVEDEGPSSWLELDD